MKINLFRDGDNIETITTTKEHHVFYVEKTGIYHIEAQRVAQGRDTEKSVSNKISVREINDVADNYLQTNTSMKTKTENNKIDGVDKYYLEMKVLNNFVKEIKEQTKLSLNLINLDLSGIHKKHPVHNYAYLKYVKESDFEQLKTLAESIEKLDYVEYCCVAPDTSNLLPISLPLNQALTNPTSGSDIAPNADDDFVTPNFTPLQTYLDAPHGMNVRTVWNKDINGSRTVVRHLDFGIYRNHEDLRDSNITVVNSRSETQDCNHGTASSGCIVATKNGFGVTGIAYGCHYYFYDTGDLDLIVNDVQPGDIVSLDIQFSINNKLLPVTDSKSWWERIKLIVDKGATVILAAGNGGLDLSEPGVMTDYGDNGSMLVGACSNKTGTRCSFSNYNQKTSLINSWGDWSVVTTGYGSLQRLPGNDRNYSNDYAGTSSATPLSSAALALIQDYAKKNHVILSAWDMRKIIELSNYTEGVSNGIGYRPNVDYLLSKVDGFTSTDLTNKYPDNFINSALFIPLVINKNQDSKLEYLFDYDNSQVNSVGLVCAYLEEGPDSLIWWEYGYSLVKVPVVNESYLRTIVNLRVSKTNACGSFTMNTATPCGSSQPNQFNMSVQYLQEDNVYIAPGNYKGTLPLYAKPWNNSDYCLNIMINVQIK